MGLDGFVSELKVLMSDSASGIGAALALWAKVVPPTLLLWRRIMRFVDCVKERGMVQAVLNLNKNNADSTG